MDDSKSKIQGQFSTPKMIQSITFKVNFKSDERTTPVGRCDVPLELIAQSTLQLMIMTRIIRCSAHALVVGLHRKTDGEPSSTTESRGGVEAQRDEQEPKF